jgi:hypothetical protein
MNPDNSTEQAGLLSNSSDSTEVRVSNLGRDTDYPDVSSNFFYLPRKCRVSTLN